MEPMTSIAGQSRPGLIMITIGAVQLQGAGGKRERKNAKGLGLRGGTFKVGMTGKGRELVDMIQRRKVDVLRVQETT